MIYIPQRQDWQLHNSSPTPQTQTTPHTGHRVTDRTHPLQTQTTLHSGHRQYPSPTPQTQTTLHTGHRVTDSTHPLQTQTTPHTGHRVTDSTHPLLRDHSSGWTLSHRLTLRRSLKKGLWQAAACAKDQCWRAVKQRFKVVWCFLNRYVGAFSVVIFVNVVRVSFHIWKQQLRRKENVSCVMCHVSKWPLWWHRFVVNPTRPQQGCRTPQWGVIGQGLSRAAELHSEGS